MRPRQDRLSYIFQARDVKSRHPSFSVRRLRGLGIIAWVAARRSVGTGQSRSAFLGNRLARYRILIPPPLLRFLPPLDITANGQLARGAFDARLPSDFVLGDPSVEPPPAATHPLAAAIRFAAALLQTLRARAMRRGMESEEARQRATADMRQMREAQERHRTDLQDCQAAALQVTATKPRIRTAWLAYISVALVYCVALSAETAWITTALADSLGIDLAEMAAVRRSAHLVLPLIGTAAFVTFVLVLILSFVVNVVKRFATARTLQEASFALLVGAAVGVLFVLSLIASIGVLRGRYSTAAVGAEESVFMQLALTGFHLAMLIGGAVAAMTLKKYHHRLAALYDQRDAFHRERDRHAQAIAFSGMTLRETERRLAEFQGERARLDAEQDQTIAELQAHVRALLDEGESIKEQREAWLNALDAAISADNEIFTALSRRYGRGDLLTEAMPPPVIRRLP